MDFIVGKWYKTNDNDIMFGKFLKLEENRFYGNVWMVDKKIEILDYPTWMYLKQMSEDTLNEVQQYLPEDHPDKIYIFEKEDLDYLVPFLTKLNII